MWTESVRCLRISLASARRCERSCFRLLALADASATRVRWCFRCFGVGFGCGCCCWPCAWVCSETMAVSNTRHSRHSFTKRQNDFVDLGVAGTVIARSLLSSQRRISCDGEVGSCHFLCSFSQRDKITVNCNEAGKTHKTQIPVVGRTRLLNV